MIHAYVGKYRKKGIDHLDILGNSLETNAKEKAGIIKKNTPVIIGEYTKETKAVFQDIAKSKNSEIHWVNHKQPLDYNLDLKGFYQKYNALTVLEVIKALNNLKRKYHISNKDISIGLKNIIKNTGLKERWQTLNENPLTICDTAHNTHDISHVVKQIEDQEYETLHIVLGMV